MNGAMTKSPVRSDRTSEPVSSTTPTKLVADPERLLHRVVPAVIPEVRAAHAGLRQPSRPRRLVLDAGVGLVLGLTSPDSVDRGRLHGHNPSGTGGPAGMQPCGDMRTTKTGSASIARSSLTRRAADSEGCAWSGRYWLRRLSVTLACCSAPCSAGPRSTHPSCRFPLRLWPLPLSTPSPTPISATTSGRAQRLASTWLRPSSPSARRPAVPGGAVRPGGASVPVVRPTSSLTAGRQRSQHGSHPGPPALPTQARGRPTSLPTSATAKGRPALLPVPPNRPIKTSR
jgi:hypothetical protein